MDRLREAAAGGCALQPERPLLVGVSGGPDSLSLMDALQQLGYSPVVAHFDHRLRPESVREAGLVRQEAENRGLPFVLGEEPVRDFARQQRLSLEEAGRILRYRFLFQAARQTGAQAVAVAHTADDQVETVLMHLLRGSGLSGLRGMTARALPNAWSREIPLVRPLLGVWREEVLAYCAERGLQPLLDASNLDARFFRNRLRRELLPYLERYNPAIRLALWKTASVLRGDHEVIERLVDEAWQACSLASGGGYVGFEAAALQGQPRAIQRRLLRRAVARLRPGLRDIGFEPVERALDFLAGPQPLGQRSLAAGLRVVREPGRFWLADREAELPAGDWPQVPEGVAIPLQVPGEVHFAAGWRLRAEAARDAAQAWEGAAGRAGPFQEWIDLESLPAGLEVRARRPGDRFFPLGMGGHSVKLSDFMIEAGLPRRARRAWPLVCAGEAIVWVPGFRLAHTFRLRPETRRAARLSLQRMTSRDEEGESLR